jgi:hypothetical protein
MLYSKILRLSKHPKKIKGVKGYISIYATPDQSNDLYRNLSKNIHEKR